MGLSLATRTAANLGFPRELTNSEARPKLIVSRLNKILSASDRTIANVEIESKGMMETCSASSLNYVFIQTCKAHRTRTAELLAKLDVHVGQEMFLAILWQEDGMQMTRLAERLEVQPPTVTRMVQRMEGSGLVERRTSEDDQRVSFVYLTNKGKAIRSEIEHMWSAIEQQMTAGMSSEDVQRFRGALAHVRSNLGGGA